MIRNDIITKALSYVGLKEEKSNNIIFNTDYYGREVNGDNYAWCCTYVWDIYRICGASKYFFGGKKTASCTTLLNYYKKNHPEWVTTDINKARQGDLVFYQFDKDSYADHIGIFERKTSDTKFYAVEGNTSLGSIGSQTNGEYVARKQRNMAKVMAFVHIEFDDDVVNPYAEPTRTLYLGNAKMTEEDVKWLQWELAEDGYDIKIDGVFTKTTEAVLMHYQKRYNLDVDGKCGPATRKHMVDNII